MGRTQRIAADLRHRIAGGEFKAGDQLPSVRDIQRHYTCSTRAAWGAFAILRGEGWAWHGNGTYAGVPAWTTPERM